MSQMGKLVRLVRGTWRKNEVGEWSMELVPTEISYGVMLQENQTFTTLVGIVKTRYLLPAETEVLLTFQFPKWML